MRSLKRKNSFGKEIPEIRDIFSDKKVEAYACKRLREVLDYLEVVDSEKVVDEVINSSKSYAEISDYEKNIHQLFDRKRITQRIPVKLGNRAQAIFDQVKSQLVGHQVLDLGCGDGKVGELIARQGRHVVLADVYENGNVTNLNMPFIEIRQGEKLAFETNGFDTTLLFTVLHHADDPMQVLTEARRVTKNSGRILVIESVYGVPGYAKELNESQQLLANIFFDHFYNRIIHYSDFLENKINVPFNFQTPKEWKQFFEKNGLQQTKLVMLGFDQPTVPEYHTFHVLEVRK